MQPSTNPRSIRPLCPGLLPGENQAEGLPGRGSRRSLRGLGELELVPSGCIGMEAC